MKLFVLLVALCLGTAFAEKVRYDNYTVYRVTPTSTRQLAALKAIADNPDGLQLIRGLKRVGDDVDLMVPPHKKAEFDHMVTRLGMKSVVLIENVQNNIDLENPEVRPKALGWEVYNTLEEIIDWMKSLEAQYPQVTLVNAGETYERREIRGVKISYKTGNPGIFIEGGIHGDEWIGPAAVTWILNQLLTSRDPAVRNIAENYDWHIFPVTNPDGYAYTFKSQRTWHRTRSPINDSFCIGVDPNRNWGFHWMENGGGSSMPCSDTYAGKSAFSEFETRGLSKFITQVSDNLKVYLSVQGWGQHILIPYGYTNEPVDNYDTLMAIAKNATEKLAARHGTKYTYGNIGDILTYPTSGTSVDWVKGTFNTPITYAFELRDAGLWSIFLPAEEIIPTAEELLDAWISILNDANIQ